MLDMKFLRENPEIVKENIKKKFQNEKLPLVDEVLELDKRNREIKQEVEALRADKNKISKKIGACMAQGKKEEAEELKKKGCDAYYFPSFEEIENFCLDKCQKGDVLITMGAGNVVNIGENLLKR